MLAKEYKLKSSDEIKLTLKEGRRFRTRNLSVFFRPLAEGHFQAAVVISKKVAGTAVTRNRIRRIIFAELQRQLVTLSQQAIGAMVIMVSQIPEDEKVLLNDLNQCLKQLSLT